MKKLISISLTVLILMVFFSYGQTWSGKIRVTFSPGKTILPQAARDSYGRLHLIYQDEIISQFPNVEIFHKYRSSISGLWSSVNRLTWNTGRSITPVIAVDSLDIIHVVCEDNTFSPHVIFYKKSTDFGQSWTPWRQSSPSNNDCVGPDISVDSSGHIFIFYFEYYKIDTDIYLMKSADHGNTWDPIKRLTWNSNRSEYPSSAVDSSDQVHLVWQDRNPGNYDIFYKNSSDSGCTWSPVKRLTWNSSTSERPKIAASGTNDIYVTWHDYKTGNYEIYYKRSTNGGSNWESTKRLTWNPTVSVRPMISAQGNKIFIAWRDNPGADFDIFIKVSYDGGIAWNPRKRVTWGVSASNLYDILTFGPGKVTEVHIFWDEEISTNSEIFHKYGLY